MENKFKIGDKVEVVRGGNGKFTIGTIFIIDDISLNLYNGTLYMNKSISKLQGVTEKDIELYESTSLKNITTKDLVQELKRREGVISTKIEMEEMARITTVDFNGNVKHKNISCSPCIILEIFD